MNVFLLSLLAPLMGNVFVDRFNEGGPFFMSLILICLIVALLFLVLGFLNLKKSPDKSKKMTGLASDSSILGLVFGLMGSIIGMIEAFDAIDALGDVSQGMMAGGLKVALLTTVFGAITFILPRIGIIIIKALHKP
ncbi:MotA/TolQ/ExbB proton channel family protein [Seonamhaeicola sp. MEBiC1930]|uniref:MotA/TolQ/ExbB proton channel family protein n=1 Tax=Seonamhaeicola sp. MEBiC01930 TaxID=2976768 RepID=UPI0032480E2D